MSEKKDALDRLMEVELSRRNFMKMSAFAGIAASVGGLVTLDFLSPSNARAAMAKPFTFALMADHHTMGPKNNFMKLRSERAVEEINKLNPRPDFVMSLGDQVHDGSDEQMKFFDELMAPCKVPIKYITGENDWYLDIGESYHKHFGATTYSWDQYGVHFIALNTVHLRDFWTARGLSAQERMDIAGTLNHPLLGPFHVGEKQLGWLRDDLAKVKKSTPIIIFSHSPLYYYYKPWNFWTEDAPEVHLLLEGYEQVQVIHGHVHHIVKNRIGNINFDSSLALGWPWPDPFATSKLPVRAPEIPIANPAKIYSGVGWEPIQVGKAGDVDITYREWLREEPKLHKPNFAIVKIFYATDRKPTGRAEPASFFGEDRGVLAFGTCEVSIPREHRIAHLEGPSILKLEFRKDPSKHIALLSVTPQSTEKFFSELRSRTDKSEEKDAFVFVHGYNVTFEDAARRTAQIHYDLNFRGAPILYSWPSRGEYEGYTADEATIEWTVLHLKEFLTKIATKSGAHTVHVIAHSMGNRALTAALKRIVDEGQGTPPFSRFKEIVLTAPDIDAGVFVQLAEDIQKAGERITLYASSKDEALVASQKFHGGFPRAGESGPSIVVLQGVDTIDVSAVDSGLLGHSYFGDNRSVITDLWALLKHRRPPAERFGLHLVEDFGKKFWVFKP